MKFSKPEYSEKIIDLAQCLDQLGRKKKFETNLLAYEVKHDWISQVVVQTNNNIIWTWYFRIVQNFLCLTAREIMYNKFETSLVVLMPTTNLNDAITYTNHQFGYMNSPLKWPQELP